MGLINLSLPSDGTTIDSSDVNNPFNTLLAEFNGNIDNDNIKAAAGIVGTKLANSTLTATQMADSINPVKRWDEGLFDYVASGCVWSADSVGASLNASMTAGVVYINGIRVPVSLVTARAFTASRDTYIDVGEDGVVDYTEVTLNAASPALAANHMRIGIITTDATDINAVGNINQGQRNAITPVISSNTLLISDSLGNRIFPTDSSGGVIGYRQITSNFVGANDGNGQNVTGLDICIVKVPTGRTLKITVWANVYNQNNANRINLYASDVTGAVNLNVAGRGPTAANSVNQSMVIAFHKPTGATNTYKAVVQTITNGGPGVEATSTQPAFIMVEVAS